MKRYYITPFIALFLVFTLSCGINLKDLEATVQIKNQNVNGYALNATVNGDSKIIANNSVEEWIIEWEGGPNDPKAVDISATYVEFGGIYALSFEVFDGDKKSVIITDF